MGRNPNKLQPGRVALICDRCSLPISGDEGYLVTQNTRWRLFHDDCQSSGAITEAATLGGTRRNGGKPIIVRSSRVSTYSLLLTTLATLASDVRVDFANTAWPALLKRIAFDTDWCQTDGRKPIGQLMKENSDMTKAAGLGHQLTMKDCDQ